MPPTLSRIGALAARAAMPHSAASRIGALAAAAALALAIPLAGCGRTTPDPGTTTRPTRTSSPPPTAARTPTHPPTTTVPRTPPVTPTFAEGTAVACNGFPKPDQIVALLRRTPGALPANATATARTGPLCAGTWQYTVVVVPDSDPLYVVTKGPPVALVLVAAGTDVCTPDVRAEAPPGIRAITRC